ncbi:serine carboxypeptidase-like 7 [Papaver somniferum]|uniref:serine carboxypeptidase-like 7 n=1 Tax=Papaver somniferum TaxID=3469 RepID=UPI000E7048EE|nr:serine carboxypeptidase-like 7 [Papaver somniferum]
MEMRAYPSNSIYFLIKRSMFRNLNQFYFNLLFLFLLLQISWVHSKHGTSYNATLIIGLSSSSSLSPSRVNHLPGFSGPLPFYLETGYVSVDGSYEEDSPSNIDYGNKNTEMFYYYAKSERNPEEDPLVFGFTGGPRFSSLSALFFEIGRHLKAPSSLIFYNYLHFQYVANIIFPDGPIYTGFSYSKSSPSLRVGDEESSKSIHQFVMKWLIGHPEFKSNPLYIGGDSYSGKIVPVVVQYLINDIETQKYPFLHLKGYLLGNPVTNRQLDHTARVPYAYGMGLLSYELFESMKENCKGKYVNFDLDNVNCLKDRLKFQECTSNINQAHISEDKYCDNLNQKPEQPIDNRRSLSVNAGVVASLEPILPIPGCRAYSLFYSNFQIMYMKYHNQNLVSGYWANNDRVLEALHVKKETVKKWIRCNYDIPYAYDISSSVEYHRNISTKLGYRALIYSGDHDYIVPHISTKAWIRSLNLSIVDDWRPWLLDDQFAGYTRTYSSGLTYATVKGAGHTAPEFRPKECYAMFERWMSHAPL